MKKTVLAAGIAVIGLGAVAVAAPDIARAAPQDRDHPTMEPMTLATAEARALALFDRMDRNGDGTIDAADRQARQDAMFDRLDTDNDGQISRTEFAARGQREGRGPMAHRGAGRGMGMVKMADADGDDAITRAEMRAAAKSHFARMDANGDGTVTTAERKAARDAMRAMHRQRSGDAG
ncbi:EF-hand domain-containing protein [uncultured Croceicoccus sp.]|uniref:EF-hand domain-containing protein n=1 Tax=uncultured Croceicoccus sp. TaxID=1295329 RepID=UPI00260ECF76|nr:EF-hand domain-containing protein [uncultured Croceicoccus sp.]